MKRVIWFSINNPPAPVQVAELERLWPGCVIVHVSRKWRNADALIREYNNLKGDEMIALVPLTIVRDITDRGYYPLWSKMTRADYTEMADFVVGTTRFRFQRFLRVVGVNMRFEELKEASV